MAKANMTFERQLTTVLKWKEQQLEEAIQWLQGVKRIEDAKQLEAYKAGFSEGYMKAYHQLSLHGLLKSE